MIMVKFDKKQAEEFLDAIQNGKAITPAGNGWSGNDMLALAGACLFGAMSQGPQSFWLRDIPQNLPDEYREANEEKFSDDLAAAIEYYGHLTMLVQDGEYDSKFQPKVAALVTQDGTMDKKLVPVMGFKNQRNILGEDGKRL